MKFKCGHEAPCGIGDLCIPCHEARGADTTRSEKNAKRKVAREKKRVKSEEQKEREKQWHKDNPRTEYQRDAARKRRGVKIGNYVIHKDGGWKLPRLTYGLQFGSFNMAHTYRSKGYADLACKNSTQ